MALEKVGRARVAYMLQQRGWRVGEAFDDGYDLLAYHSKRIASLAESILGKHISAHSLRHSFATNMIRKTNKIVATSEYLGHSSTTMTLDMYVHEVFSLSELL
jgi:integrase